MRWNWMPGALLAIAIASPSSAQISVYIGTPPPAIVYEEPGPPPDAGFVGSKDIGGRWVTITSGFGDTGSNPRLREHTGFIHTTTTIAKAGNATMDIGITRTMTMVIGANMVTDEAIITTTTSSEDRD